MLDLNDIALFVEVVQSGSFAEAARRLGIPPNTVSRRIQSLEAQLGTRLLQRSTRKLSLTAAGELLHERSAVAVGGLREAGQEIALGSREPSGRVRVAAPADFFDYFQMAWLAEFLADHPRVRVEFVLSDALSDLIAERIDVAFRAGALADSGFVGRQVATGNNMLMASPAYLARRPAPATLAALLEHDCVGFAGPNGQVPWRLARADAAVEEIAFQARFTGNTMQAMRKAALAGLGIALLPHRIAAGDLRDGNLVQVLPDYHVPGTGMNIVYPSRRHLPPAVAIFMDWAGEKFKGM
ncbi:LysR family transcriptional regulator [Duganella radicis]|uniref:LysR family transcriptional regulator n=1 Tax=Duganella radicis TaxID=551988 RepID=A0A6L6PT52_9BURK|nr:LysR family transcriptional regulator [Duganella radicis]MTV41395.1 LysR family transcriptional regulator [Duganella radicis]